MENTIEVHPEVKEFIIPRLDNSKIDKEINELQTQIDNSLPVEAPLFEEKRKRVNVLKDIKVETGTPIDLEFLSKCRKDPDGNIHPMFAVFNPNSKDQECTFTVNVSRRAQIASFDICSDLEEPLTKRIVDAENIRFQKKNIMNKYLYRACNITLPLLAGIIAFFAGIEVVGVIAIPIIVACTFWAITSIIRDYYEAFSVTTIYTAKWTGKIPDNVKKIILDEKFPVEFNQTKEQRAEDERRARNCPYTHRTRTELAEDNKYEYLIVSEVNNWEIKRQEMTVAEFKASIDPMLIRRRKNAKTWFLVASWDLTPKENEVKSEFTGS